MTAIPKISAAPSWLIAVPRGIVKDEMSRETPISFNLFMLNGILALEDIDENAKNITEMYFLKNFKGFNLVKIIISRG